MRTIPIVAVFLPLLAASPALAQGTAAQRAACMGDAFRLCASAVPNVGKIAACLRQERASISPGCRAELDKADGVPQTKTAEAPPPPPAPRSAERPRPAPRIAAAPEPRGPAKMTRRERVAAAPEPVSRTTRPNASKVTVSQSGRTRVITRTVYVYVPSKAATRQAAPRRSFARRGGGNSQMAQAMYWMQAISSYAGSSGYGSALGGLGGLGGLGDLGGL